MKQTQQNSKAKQTPHNSNMKKIFLVLCLSLITGHDLFSQIVVPFTKRYSVTQKGGLVMVANSILTCNGGGSCTAAQNEIPPAGTQVNNNGNSAYIDIDGDAATFSSSSANLNLPLCSKISFAGLYWSSVITSGNVKYAQRKNVKIKVPGSTSYTTLTADTSFDVNSGYVFYNCFKNITSIVSAAGNGTFTIADMVSNSGSTNQWGGWTIVVVYRNELLTEKNITVFDGLANVNSSSANVTVNVNGFFTPPSGAVNFELGEIAFDGDRGYTGDSLLFKGNASFIPVSDALHPAADVFNSTITNNGTQVLTRNPAYANLLGYDACIFKPDNSTKNYLTNGATSASIKVTTGGETVLVRALTSVIDTYEPHLEMQKSVSDINGGTPLPGDTLAYTIVTNNSGNDTSVATTIIDTIPFNSSYVSGSMRITSGPNTGLKTDVPGDDQGELISSGGFQILQMRLGNGANNTSGGQMPHLGSNNTTIFTFKTKITDDCTKLLCNPVIGNQAGILFNGYISGLSRISYSKPALFDSLGCPVEGYTNTTITVPVTCAAVPDTSIGGCLPLVFATVPNIRSGYTYYDSFWLPVSQANTIGPYHGIRKITGSTCADTINISVFVAIPTTANAGSDQILCNASNITLTGNNATIGSGTWRKISGPNNPTIASPNSSTTSVTGLIPGTYTFSWTITTGCDSTADTLSITNYALPTGSNAGPDQTICNVTSVTLAANNPASGSGNWILVSGPNVPVITSPSVPNTTVTGMTIGVYTFRWTTSNGACSNSSDDVQITINSLPTTAIAGNDQALCNVTSTNVSGNPPLISSGLWTTVSGPNVPNIISPSSPNTGINGMIAGVYVFRWTISNGVCPPSTDDVQISISSLPTVANAGIDQSLCNATSALFAGNTPTSGSGSWTTISGPNVPTIVSPSNPASTVTGLVDGVYIFRWTVSNGDCASSFDEMQMTVYDLPPTADAGLDQVLCNASSITMNGNSPTIGSGVWTFISGPNVPIISNPSDPLALITSVIEGVYVFRWTISYGICTPTSDDVQITLHDLPTVSNAGGDQVLCNAPSITLSGNNPSSGNGLWTLVSGPNAPTITSPSLANSNVTGLIDGIYIFKWTITNGNCPASSDSVQITNYDLPTVAVAGSDQALCNVNSTNLAGNTATIGSGVWTQLGGPNTATIVSPVNPSTSITGLIPGVYFFKWTISYGTCPSTSDNVRITIYNLPTTPTAGPDQNLCNVVNTTLAGNTPVFGTGLWTLVSGPNIPIISNTTIPTPTVSGMIPGVYVFRWTISNGTCVPITDDVIITNTAPPTAANSGPDQNICNVNSVTLAANNPVIGTGIWTYISGPNIPVITAPTNPASTVTGMIAGDYFLRWTISNGFCPNSVNDILITISDLPTTANAGPNQDLCSVTSTVLIGNVPVVGTGIWTRVSGPNVPTIVDPDSATTDVNGMIFGTYKFRWSISNGVCPVSSSNIDVTIFNVPTVANAGPDQNLCNVNNTTLAGNVPGAGFGTWTFISGPNSPTITAVNNPSSTVTGMILGTYQFGWTITNGSCSSATDTVEVINYDLPSSASAGADQALCSVTNTTLYGNSPAIGTGTWSYVSGPNVPTIIDPSDSNTTVTGMITGIYILRWTVSSGSCVTSTDDIQIQIFNIPLLVDAGPDQNICNVTTATMAGNIPSSGTGTWTWISGPGTPSITAPTNPSTTITSLSSGTFEFGWKISNGVCFSQEDTIIVNVYDLPTTANAGPNQNLCNTNNTILQGNSPVLGTGTWTLISGPNSPTITDPTDSATTVTNMIVGTYIFRWTIQNGSCSSSTSDVQVTIFNLPVTVNAGPDQNLCNVITIILNGNNPPSGSGTWTFINGPVTPTIVSPNTPSTFVSGMVPGIFEFGWTITNGVCVTATDKVKIHIYNTPTTANAGPDQNECNVNKVQMQAVPAVSGNGRWSQWTGPNTAIIADSSLENTLVTGMIPGLYGFIWTVINGTCSISRDTVAITIYDIQSNALAGTDQTLCNIDSTIMAANTPVIGIGSWSLISGPNVPSIVDPSNPSTKINSLIPGTYEFNWTISNGTCTASEDTIEIIITAPTANANAGPDQSICNTTTAILGGNPTTSGSGAWTLLNGPNTPVISVPSDPNSPVVNLTFGTYDFIWTVSNGSCTSTSDTVQLSVFDLPGAAMAGLDQDLCNVSSVVMSGNTPFAGIGTWTLISGPGIPAITDPNDPLTTITNLVQGDYIFRWSITNSICTITNDDVEIKIANPVSSANAGNDQGICNTNAAAFSALTPAAGSGSWTIISGPNTPVIASPNSENSTVTGLVDGTYIFCWTVSNGACSSSTDTVSISIYDLPTVANAGNLQSSCDTVFITLTGNPVTSGTGNWSMISGPNVPLINSPSSPVTIVTNITEGTYTFVWTISNGACSASSDTVQISTFKIPTNAFAGPDQSICFMPSLSLNANAPSSGTGIWSQVSGPNTSVIVNPNSANSLVSGLVPGIYTYRWTVSNNTCTPSTDDSKLTVFANPSPVDAGIDQQWCDSTSTIITGNTPSVGFGFWSFISGPSVPTVNSPANISIAISDLQPGVFTFQWTIANGLCFQTDQMQVTIDSTPDVTVTEHYFNTCKGEKIVTLEANGASTYSWSPNSFLDNPNISNPIATISQNIIYWVTGSNPNGCSSTDSVFVEVCDSIIISNGFSPDGDGENDKFVVIGLETYPNNFLQIFNRWGNLLYEKKNYDNSWDGIPTINKYLFGSGLVQQGTYFYTLNLGNDRQRSGFIEIKY